ncbi:MAG: phosphoglucosamine mutase [Pelovirga sp.]
MEKKLFGTDGVRGVANIDPMTAEVAMQLGRAVAYVFKQDNGRRHRIVIGKDTRLSGYMLENAMVAGICSMGVDVLIVGPLPTPGIAFITSSMRADAGVVISASHNLYQDNGIKFFSGNGFKLPDAQEIEIEDLIINHRIDALRPIAEDVGKAYRIDDAIGRYIVFLKNSFPRDLDLQGVRIVLDCAHGAGYRVAPSVLTELGAEVFPLGVDPNGLNINDGCGSMHPEVMAAKVKEYRADLGMALDGDADRVIFVDEKGQEVDGDHILALCGTELMKTNSLRKKTVVATVMSNMGLDIAMKEAGGKIVRTGVGDRYVVEEMVRGGYNLGGEQSGHMIFLDHNTTGDGMLSALQVLAIMQRSGKPLSELAGVMTSLPQVLVNVKVRKKAILEKIAPIKAAMDAVEAEVAGRGRLLVRYSGTEPLLRIMVEGEDQNRLTQLAEELAAVVREHLGA